MPKHIGMRSYFPTLRRATGGVHDGARASTSSTASPAYRMVVKLGSSSAPYYGIQGMKWRTPPICSAPHDNVIVDGRELEVYYDGKKVRLVAWRTPNAVYYVHNTLDRALSRAQLLAIARCCTQARPPEPAGPTEG